MYTYNFSLAENQILLQDLSVRISYQQKTINTKIIHVGKSLLCVCVPGPHSPGTNENCISMRHDVGGQAHVGDCKKLQILRKIKIAHCADSRN